MLGALGKLGSVGNGATPPRRVRAILNKYGATLLLPGVSGAMRFGYQPGNYRESTGQTLAVADQQVGLVVDAARVPGPELVTNGDFSNGTTGWTNGAGLTPTVVGGVLQLARSGAVTTSGAFRQSFPVVAGRAYRLNFSVANANAGRRVDCATQVLSAASAAVGNHSVVFIADGPTATLNLWAENDGTTTHIDNVFVRELPGIHASQSTSGFQPVLRRGLVNLLTYSNDFSNAAWTKSDGASATATTLTITAAATSRAFQGKTFSGDITVAVQCDTSDAGKQLHLGVWASGMDGLTTGRTPTTLTIPASGVVCYSWAGTVSGTNVGIIRTGTEFTLNNPRIALFQGTVTAEEIIAAGGIPVTTSAPASSANGIQSWQFDGTDDRLSLSAVPFQMADDHFVVAGCVKSTNKWQVVCAPAGNSSSTSRAGSIVFSDTGIPVASWVSDDGVQTNLNGTEALENGISTVLSATKGTDLKLRVNGILKATAASPSGTFSFNAGYVGFAPGSGPVWLNGHIHGIIFGKGAITDSELLTLERFMATLQGRAL